MSSLGIGYMLFHLGGNSASVKAYTEAQGKTIAALRLDPDDGDGGALHMHFTDGTGIKLWDGARSCCEERYMHTDDDLPAFIGATFTDVQVRDGDDIDDNKYEAHEVQFVLVNTSKGAFTLETHNIHNGYYGGIAIVAASLAARDGDDTRSAGGGA